MCQLLLSLLFSGSSESLTVFRKLHFEGVEQFLVSAYDHPGFTSRQQDAKHTGSASLISKLTFFLFHVFPSLVRAPVTLPILFFISFMQSLFQVTILPKYTLMKVFSFHLDEL